MNLFHFLYLGFVKAETCELHFGIKYAGCTIKSVPDVPNWRICSMICFETSKCKAWTWAHLRSTYRPSSCWLKRSKCNITDSGNMVSGEAKCGNL